MTNGYKNGGVFVFNTQKGLSDTCKAYAAIQYGDDEGFGEQAICMGDLFGNGITSIMIGQNIMREPGIILDGQGAITIFNGDLSYGWPVSGVLQTQSQPVIFEFLSQNYPNPFSSSTQIEFQVVEPLLYDKELSLNTL